MKRLFRFLSKMDERMIRMGALPWMGYVLCLLIVAAPIMLIAGALVVCILLWAPWLLLIAPIVFFSWFGVKAWRIARMSEDEFKDHLNRRKK